MNRRTFALVGAMGAAATHLLVKATYAKTGGENLVPETPGTAPNYWCTWAVQNYMFGQHAEQVDISMLQEDSGASLARHAMTQTTLLSSQGWATRFFPRCRRDLYLMLDDGWETGGMATFELDHQKFFRFLGSPADRLRKLNAAVRAMGWRSLAVWCRNPPEAAQDEPLVVRSVAAGVPYWKIDIGDMDFRLPEIRDAHHLPLLFEHVHGEEPLNGDWKQTGRFGPQPRSSRRQQILARTDVYRTYDVTSILSLPTTLDRVAEMLYGAQDQPSLKALLNVEDEVYVAAVLGCTMGVLRHPWRELRPTPDVDLFFNGPRQTKQRMDEVERALRWHRLAPPFAAGLGTFERSASILTDSWTFRESETWSRKLAGQTVHQGAPAVISRNMALPLVTATGDRPFVFASRFPNGAAAIGFGERTHTSAGWTMPSCAVDTDFGEATGPFGIFGCVDKLTLTLHRPPGTTRLMAQDLMSTQSIDLTYRLRPDGRTLALTEMDLQSIGLQAASKDDLSSPAMVLAWR